MNAEATIEQLFSHLVSGDRVAARALVGRTLATGMTPAEFANSIAWPLHETLFKLERADQVTKLSFNYAIRLLRSIVDQLQPGYRQTARSGGTVLLLCGSRETEDLGGQIAADLLEADGWTVRYGGGNVAADEILSEVNTKKPDWLVLFSTAASDAPQIRQVVDTLREIGAHPKLRVAVGGGVFNRAEGLAEEIGIRHTAKDPMALVELLAGRPVAAKAGRLTAVRTPTAGRTVETKARYGTAA